MDSKELLKKLTEADGISGNEKEISRMIRGEFDSSVNIAYDKLGSIVVSQPDVTNAWMKVMIAAHMDEVGFMVTAIDNNGYIKFIPIGGWWSNVLLAQKVKITTKEGRKITGIIGSKPPHLMEAGDTNKVVEMKSMFIDIGVSSKDEVIKAGIAIGDMITPLTNFEVMENPSFISGKALDNRAGCAATIEVFKNFIENGNTGIDLYGAFTVQEEVGLRGAATAVNKIKPDLAIVLDVSLATDYPGVSADTEEKVGSGPVINILDGSSICNKGLLDFVIKVAKEAEIPFQIGLMPKGGTDAGRIHLSSEGVPTIGISFATRYIHSHSSIIHLEDYKNAIKLINTVLTKINTEEYIEMLHF